MKSIFKPLLLAGALVAAGFTAYAQAPAGPMMGASGSMHEGMGHGGRMGKMDPAKMQERMAKRQAKLKADLNITAAQEGAWASFTAAMKPPANMMANHPDRAAMEKLTTPERIDQHKSMRATHLAEMDKRSDAVKTFYATLTPEQKKVFDAQAMHQGKWHGGGHGNRH